MKNRFLTLVFTMSAILACATTHAAGTAHSLDQVPSKFTTPEARASYNQEMGNTKEPDGFGTHLPAGFTRQAVIAQLAPGQNPSRAVLVGVKPWPQRSGAFVAIVCIAPTDELAKQALQFHPPQQCDGYDPSDSSATPKNLVWLGVFDRGTDGIPHLIARTEKPLDHPTDWTSTNMQAPDEYDSSRDKDGLRPAQWLRFDLAPYQLRAGESAFGVRAGWEDSYSGGGADFEALYLFRVDGAALHLVFAQPMMFSSDIAGDWHPNGTRDHDISDGSNTLTVLLTSTDGFHDLQLRERRGKWRQTFVWSAQDGEYVPR